jgi:uncharacterized OB-fold protein
MQPTQYWREAKQWPELLGKTGVVVVSTVIRVAAPELASQTPYSFAIVEFAANDAGEKIRRELMGVGHQTFVAGDKVKCVLRKLGTPSKTGIIPYGIKIELCR